MWVSFNPDKIYGEDETVSLADALACFTINGAFLSYDDDIRGSLAVGKYADLVILDADLLSASDDEILAMADKVLVTLVGGEEAYRADGFSW